MARKLAKKAKPKMVVHSETVGEPITQDFLSGKATRVYRVTEHRRPPEYVRSLVVIDTDDPLWMNADDNATPMVHAYPEAKDGIVWIIPPHDASELAIERVVRACKNDGAHTIKLMPRAPSADVVPAQQHAGDAEHAPQTAREMVLEMADEANSTNTKALKKLLNDVLGEEGL